MQAIDWFAYEEFKEVPQNDTGIRVRPVRESLRALLHLPDGPLIYRETGLKKLCQNPAMFIPVRNEKNKRFTKIRFDRRRVDRLPRRLKRLRKECHALMGKSLAHEALLAHIQKAFIDLRAHRSYSCTTRKSKSQNSRTPMTGSLACDIEGNLWKIM